MLGSITIETLSLACLLACGRWGQNPTTPARRALRHCPCPVVRQAMDSRQQQLRPPGPKLSLCVFMCPSQSLRLGIIPASGSLRLQEQVRTRTWFLVLSKIRFKDYLSVRDMTIARARAYENVCVAFLSLYKKFWDLFHIRNLTMAKPCKSERVVERNFTLWVVVCNCALP